MATRVNDPDPQRLLSDEDFVALMEAEHAQSRQPLDHHEKDIVWQSLRRRLRRPSRPWVPVLLSAALILVALVPILLRKETLPTGTFKGSKEGGLVPFQLLVLESRQPLVLKGQPQKGQSLLFQYSSPTTTYVALTLELNRQPPVVLFRASEPRIGFDMLLGLQQELFSYELDQSPAHLRFCLWGAGGWEELDRLIRKQLEKPLQGRDEYCQSVDIP